MTTPDDPAARLDAAWRAFAWQKRRQSLLLAAGVAVGFAVSIPVGDISLATLVDGLPRIFDYIGATLPVLRLDHLGADIGAWYWGFWRYLRLMADTVLIAYAGTLLGLIGALALCFPASSNLVRNRWIYFTCRRMLEFARSVPDLVFALIFVYAFGIGAMPGVLAVGLHSMGALGKLFSEVNENLDQRAIGGVTATGASWFAVMRFAVLPQVLPNFVSYTLFRFEINVRLAAVLGFVGAGGIGQELYTSIRSFAYVDVSAVVLVIVVAVSLIDIASEAVRTRFIDVETLR